MSGEDIAVSPSISFDVDNVGVSGSFTQESISYPFVVISDPKNILTEYKVSQVSSLVQVSQSEEELSDVSSGAGFAVVVPEYVDDSNDSLLVSFDENYSSEFFGGIPEPSTVFCLGYISREKLSELFDLVGIDNIIVCFSSEDVVKGEDALTILPLDII